MGGTSSPVAPPDVADTDKPSVVQRGSQTLGSWRMLFIHGIWFGYTNLDVDYVRLLLLPVSPRETTTMKGSPGLPLSILFSWFQATSAA